MKKVLFSLFIIVAVIRSACTTNTPTRHTESTEQGKQTENNIAASLLPNIKKSIKAYETYANTGTCCDITYLNYENEEYQQYVTSDFVYGYGKINCCKNE